uniref:Uncharacterized protein n=1 Tax=Ciona savignyi TaxID=51511 RepID=H2YZG7_CIOSA
CEAFAVLHSRRSILLNHVKLFFFSVCVVDFVGKTSCFVNIAIEVQAVCMNIFVSSDLCLSVSGILGSIK